MMLYIRTQDRMTLVPLKGVVFISSSFPQDYKDTIFKTKDQELKKKLMNDDSKMVWLVRIEINDNEDTLGKYQSKERALEVLEAIEQHVIGRMFLPESTYEMREDLAIGSSAYVKVESEKIISLPLVYQMPKE